MTRVSVITPCHLVERFIPRVLNSVAAQTFTDWEHIVVDDGSPDGTAALVAERVAVEPRLSLLRQANAGVIAARNRGFDASDPATSYVLFLDGDDELKPTMLERMVGYLDAHPDVSMLFCENEAVDAEGRPTRSQSPGTRYTPTRFGVRRIPREEPATPFAALFFWGCVTPSVSLLRRSVFEMAGGFSEDQGFYAEDLDLWLKIALRGTIHFLPEQLVVRRIRADSHSRHADIPGQERRLFERWLHADWLTAAERQMVHKLWRQRQGRLLPRLWLAWGTEHLRRGEFVPATLSYLRGGKRFAHYATATLRGRLPAGPVW